MEWRLIKPAAGSPVPSARIGVSLLSLLVHFIVVQHCAAVVDKYLLVAGGHNPAKSDATFCEHIWVFDLGTLRSVCLMIDFACRVAALAAG